MHLTITRWPQIPKPLGQGEVALICIEQVATKSTLQKIARATIHAILHAWGHTQARLIETDTGPRLEECGNMVLSLSYTQDKAWIAFAYGHSVGLDATPVRPFAELDSVARLFLGPEAECIITAQSPETAFAEAWSRLEASCKYNRHPLREWSGKTLPAPQHLAVREGDIALSVVLDR